MIIHYIYIVWYILNKIKYPELFNGIGKLKDFEVHLFKDPVPVAQKHGRVPSHFRKQVEEKSRRAEEADIFEKVNTPIHWVSCSYYSS